MSDSAKRCQIVEWRPKRKGARASFVTAHFPGLHMTFSGCAAFEKGTRRWVQPPSRPLQGDDGKPLLDADGKPRWAPLIKFTSREASDRFSDAVISALLRQHPDAFGDGGRW
jgi:hypothetical protein